MSNNRAIGILSRLDLDWLDVAAARVAEGVTPEEVRDTLFELLSPILAGGRRSGSACSKTVTVLARVWSNVDESVVGMRDRAIALLAKVTTDERMALHWAMLSANYPFWADVGATAGRLLALQGVATSTQIARRMTETWGDRSTVLRSARRITRSMIRWGILIDADDKGVYQAPARPFAIGPEVSQLLLEALLHYEEVGSMPLEQVKRHPALYPFALNLAIGDLRRAAQFEVYRQGLDMDMVRLAE